MTLNFTLLRLYQTFRSLPLLTHLKKIPSELYLRYQMRVSILLWLYKVYICIYKRWWFIALNVYTTTIEEKNFSYQTKNNKLFNFFVIWRWDSTATTNDNIVHWTRWASTTLHVLKRGSWIAYGDLPCLLGYDWHLLEARAACCKM